MKCFVIMPFSHENSNSIYENWVKPAIEEIIYEGSKIICHRADKSLRPGEIINDLIENLIDSEIVIADLSGKNPNVFYELGVRHTLSNNSILISQQIEDVPFDLRPQRVIIYKYNPDGMIKLQKDIKAAVISIFESKDTIDNPVRKFLYDKEIKKFYEGSNLPGYNLIQSLLGEISSLKSNFAEQFLQLSTVLEKVVAGNLQASVNSSPANLKELSFFEGVWYNESSKSTRYAKLIKGELYFPYCYAGNDRLSAHYYDLKLIGNTLIGKFSWFTDNLYGFVFYHIVDENTLEGGWWYSHDMPKDNIDNYWFLKDKINKMVKSKMIRLPDVKPEDYPDWAKDFFKKNE